MSRFKILFSKGDEIFTSKVRGKSYFNQGGLCCNSKSFKYLITCNKCNNEYLGSAVNFKCNHRVRKSDMKSKKNCHGTSNVYVYVYV